MGWGKIAQIKCVNDLGKGQGQRKQKKNVKEFAKGRLLPPHDNDHINYVPSGNISKGISQFIKKRILICLTNRSL